jgi:hypothetical protein
MSKLVLRNIVDLLEVLDAVKHLIDLVKRFLCNLLAMHIYEFV